MSTLGFALRTILTLAFVVASGFSMSCQVNEFCLNCATSGDGGLDDAPEDAPPDPDDAPDGGPCVPSGPEVCDGVDNDCDGTTDQGNLPEVGDPCPNQMGECAGGVKQCMGGQIRCSKQPAQEVCDLKDNDCNGLTDEGDPGGGTLCGTNVGECVAGTNHCVSGQIICQGFVGPNPMGELCNGLDDDCDAKFDEGLQNLGPCVAGVDGPIEGDTGQCVLGTRSCLGGGVVCTGAVFPTFELCNAVDEDCDGNPTNGYSLATDPLNCGMCGMVCNLPNAFEGCAGGMCTVAACAPGFHDVNQMPGDGCEYACTITGNEICDGEDNDCDGVVDENVLLPSAQNFCNSLGECLTGTTVTCNAGMLRCNYNNPDVSKDAMGMIIPETSCDNKDNDCDGIVDNQQTDKGQACGNGLLGVCRSTGTLQCNPLNLNGPTVCQFTVVGTSPSTETCDGLDNNCNGTVDDGAAGGNMPGQEWVTIPGAGAQIMKYEASRPDARAAEVGTIQTHACSRPGAQPWTNITYPQAIAACSSIGARLCTEAEWQTMCVPPTPFPVSATGIGTGTDQFVFIEAESGVPTTVGGATRAWTRISPPSLDGVTAMQVPDLGFTQDSATNAIANSSRLDYQVTLTGGTAYRFWMRMRSPAASIPTNNTAATNTLAPQSAATTQVGDLVIVFTWTRVTNNAAITHTLQGGFTQIRTQALDDGDNDGRLSVAYRVATAPGIQTYQAYTSNIAAANNFSGIVVLKAGEFDVGNILSNGVASTSNAVPDPPNPGTLTTAATVLAVAGWHLTASQNLSATPPCNYTELWEMSGNNTVDLSVAARLRDVGQSADPDAFNDNQTPNGTASMTIAIGFPGAGNSRRVWTALAAGTTAATNANTTTVQTSADNQWQWVVSPSFTAAAGGGTHTFSLYTRDDGLIIDTIAVSRQSTTSPTFDNSWAYQNNPRMAQPTTCNSDDLDTDTGTAGDQDGILATGALPACFANQTGTNDAFDMTGNVKEWTQARAPGQNPLRGGASNNEVLGTTCKLDFSLANDTFFFPNVGFRCCR